MRRIWGWLVSSMGAALLLGLQTTPDQIRSNVSVWAKFFGADTISDKIAAEPYDYVVMAIGIVLLVTGPVVWLMHRKRKSAAAPPSPPAVEARSTPELDQLRLDIDELAQLLSDWSPYNESAALRLRQRVSATHTIWLDKALIGLRDDFLNSCNWASHCRKEFKTAEEDTSIRAEIRDRAQKLQEAITLKYGSPGIAARISHDAQLRREAVRVSDAIDWIIDNSNWEPAKDRSMRVPLAAIELRQAAKDGEVTIRGRREINRNLPFENFDNTWDDIPKDYWFTHNFDLTAVCCNSAHEAIPETEPVSLNQADASKPTYGMLRVWRHELDKRWPPKTEVD